MRAGWGSNQSGALGDDQLSGSQVPVPTPGLSRVSAVAGSWSTGYALVPTPPRA